MERIAIFGGTFNPIHNGHLHLAREFASRLRANKVLLVPTRLPPHKAPTGLASAEDRLAMCRLAAKQDTLFEVCDLELKREGASYTADTLRQLKKQSPKAELYLIMGEDMFLTLEQWRNPEDIYSLCTLCAAPRGYSGLSAMMDYAARIEQSGAKYRLENLDYLPVSSTMVRMAVKNGQNIAAMVPPMIAQYISDHNLYLE